MPGRDAGEFAPAEIDKIAKDTMAGRVFIMDTRSQSQAKLQQVYNKIRLDKARFATELFKYI